MRPAGVSPMLMSMKTIGRVGFVEDDMVVRSKKQGRVQDALSSSRGRSCSPFATMTNLPETSSSTEQTRTNSAHIYRSARLSSPPPSCSPSAFAVLVVLDIYLDSATCPTSCPIFPLAGTSTRRSSPRKTESSSSASGTTGTASA